MRDLSERVAGERMEPADFRADFEREFWQTGRLGFWKLERQQFFREPGYDPWEAFARGDWDESLRLLADSHADILAEHRRIQELGFSVRRVRVVEQPLTPYLQWELHALRMREKCGSGIRVVRPAQIASLESDGPLPEICTIDLRIMYQAFYDDGGVLDYVLKYTDHDLIRRCQRIIAEVYATGEPLADYFGREVAPLPPPLADQPSV